MEMGEKIKYHRERLHMTLEELGNKVGVGKSTVRKWENGMIANMKRDKIAKLAEALEVSPGYLMGWVETADRNYDPRALDNIYTDIPDDDTPEGQLTSLSHDHSDIDKAILLYEEYQKAPDDVRSVIDRLLKSSQPET